MGVRILEADDYAVLYCSTTMWAFGPLFDSVEKAQAFLDGLPQDARLYNDKELERKYSEFLEQYEAED